MNPTTENKTRRDLLNRLRRDPAVLSKDISYLVEADTVTLAGSVRTWSQRRAAETAAKSIPGIHHVVNLIEVTGNDASPPDADVVQQAVAKIVTDRSARDGAVVSVSVRHGILTLHGTVRSAQAKDDLLRHVGNVDGVLDVVDRLALARPEVPEDRKTAARVRQALDEIHLVDADIHIRVAGDEVMLMGPVSSPAFKAAAVAAAREACDGAVDVEDRLFVTGSR